MKGSVHVICRPEIAPGFRLTGVHTLAVDHPAEATRRLRELTAAPDTSVLLVQDDLVPLDSSAIAPRAERPIVVPFPGPQREIEDAAAYIADILRRAVGYRVRLE